MRNDSADAIVIGGGVVGCSVAYSLARSGRHVTVVDSGSGAGSGSTSASSAVVRFNYSTWEGVATAWESYARWQQWSRYLGGDDDAGLARFITTGGVVLDSPGQDPATVTQLFDRAHIPYEVWDSNALARRMPMLDVGSFYPPKAINDPAFFDDASSALGGIWVDSYGFVDDAALAAHNLMAAAQRYGAQFLFRHEVATVSQHDGRVTGIELVGGDVIHAPVVVNAAGPWSANVNEIADVLSDFNVRTRPLRQEVHQIPLPGDMHPHAPLPLVADLDLGTYFRGTPSGDLLVGGAEPACDELHWLDDADQYDPHPTKEIFDAQIYRAARRIPELAIPDEPKGIVGVYDVSDDWIPIYDKTLLPGFFVAIGTSGNQFKNAPVIGDMLTALIDADDSGIDHDTDPVQLTLPHTEAQIDLSAFSRRRAVNRESSFSVMG